MMITSLQVGMRLLLPSGNMIILRRRDRGTWVCEYTTSSKNRGEVEFSGAYLRKFARALHCAKV